VTRAMSIVVAVSLSTAGAAAEHGLRPVSANPRELPSLLQKWTWKGQAESAIFVDGVIYVRGEGRVAAIKADNGKGLWETVCAQGEGLVGQGPVIDGDVVAVSFNGKLALLDRETGRVVKTLELGVVYNIVASPLLVVAAGRNDRVDLVRIDNRSGEVLARTEVGGIVYDVRLAGSLAVATVDHVAPGAGGSDEILAGYRVDGLGEAWRVVFDGFPDLEWIEGSLYAAEAEGEGDESCKVYRRIDTESGQLGPTLPQRVESRVDGGLTWELEIVGLKEGKLPARLRRNSIKTGQPLWTVDLPGNPHGWVRDGDALYLHCDHEGGRGYLIVLDWATGAVKQAAYGLRDVRGLFSNADTMIAWQEGGLTAFSGRSFGAPERHGHGLREEVEEILRG
jgi:outer membrane protein assembly factor BamB